MGSTPEPPLWPIWRLAQHMSHSASLDLTLCQPFLTWWEPNPGICLFFVPLFLEKKLILIHWNFTQIKPFDNPIHNQYRWFSVMLASLSCNSWPLGRRSVSAYIFLMQTLGTTMTGNFKRRQILKVARKEQVFWYCYLQGSYFTELLSNAHNRYSALIWGSLDCCIWTHTSVINMLYYVLPSWKIDGWALMLVLAFYCIQLLPPSSFSTFFRFLRSACIQVLPHCGSRPPSLLAHLARPWWAQRCSHRDLSSPFRATHPAAAAEWCSSGIPSLQTMLNGHLRDWPILLLLPLERVIERYPSEVASRLRLWSIP